MIKRGIIGPHRCSLCCNALETMDHLFVDCPFTQEVWNISLHGLNVTAPTQITVVTLFSSWKARYPHAVQSKSIWNRIWQAIPKFLCWKIWLARNDQIFNNSLHSPSMVAAKEKYLLLETMAHHSFKNENSLLPEEKKWLGTFILWDKKKSLFAPSTLQDGDYETQMQFFKHGGGSKEKLRFFLWTPPKETQGMQEQAE
jgi:hypothetical protein